MFKFKKILAALKNKARKTSLYRTYKNIRLYINIRLSKIRYRKKIKEVKRKDEITVVFLLIFPSNWKYDGVYNKLQNSSIFKPLVVICPNKRLNGNIKEQMVEMKIAESFCKEKKYNYVASWCEKSEEWLDLNKLNPDIIFFSNPHNITNKEYQLKSLLKYLTCYVPYSIRTDHLVELAFNAPFQQMTWVNFYETQEHLDIARKVAYNKGENVKVVGYPTFDQISEYKRNLSPSSKKTIIWAPHWTIPKASNLLDRSCFLDYADFFLLISKEYKDKLNIIFRPHPFLKSALYQCKGWGKEKTDKYYDFWADQKNTSLSTEDYTYEFADSQLLIHDSVSFLAEYMATEQPAVFTTRKSSIDIPFNSFGQKCLEAHYIAENVFELEVYINDLLLNYSEEKDTKLRLRKAIKNQLSMSRSSSEMITNYLKTELR